jgi:hypothetical protein
MRVIRRLEMLLIGSPVLFSRNQILLFSVLVLLIYQSSLISGLAQNATTPLTGTVVDQNNAVLTSVNISVISNALSVIRVFSAGTETLIGGSTYLLSNNLTNVGTANSPAGTMLFARALQVCVSNRPLPLSETDSAAPIPGSLPTATDSFFVFDPNLKLPRVYQWNAALEHSLGVHQVVTASYVAAIGRDLLRVEERQNVNPNLLGFFGNLV